ncbi:hypothetical protein [Dactylosporangium salmoneum]|uniref:Uncharacterized protein n=1 Tax=Dactylosporangium salmoneum TaxID=53361 RepID=A0ABP5U5F1_9ACTN
MAVASSGAASSSLLLLLLAAASQVGAWCGVVGLPSLNPVLAAEMGVVLDRLALLPDVGAEWTSAVAALLDGLDVVVVATSQVPSADLCGRLAARARQRGSVLVPFGGWSQPDVVLHAEAGVWEGWSRAAAGCSAVRYRWWRTGAVGRRARGGQRCGCRDPLVSMHSCGRSALLRRNRCGG